MRLSNISLPYPVLGVRDDVLPPLDADCLQIELAKEPDAYRFTIKLKQENRTITRLIQAGRAEYTCEIDCQKAYLRECVASPSPSFNVVLPRRKVNGRINFNCFVTVKEPIKAYSNPDFNEDYEGCSFSMKPGDILVAFPQAHFDADIKFDRLQAAGSFMVIREDATIPTTRFDIASDKIAIVLPTDLYDIYAGGVGDRNMEIIHSSMVYNALCYALTNIPEYSETLWARCINTRIDTEPELAQYKEFTALDVPQLAQALLGDPYRRMLVFLNKSNAQTDEE